MTRRSNLDAGGPKGRGGSGTEPEKMMVSPSRMQLVATDERAAVFVGREECRGAGTEAGLVSSLAFCEITVRITLSVERTRMAAVSAGMKKESKWNTRRNKSCSSWKVLRVACRVAAGSASRVGGYSAGEEVSWGRKMRIWYNLLQHLGEMGKKRGRPTNQQKYGYFCYHPGQWKDENVVDIWNKHAVDDAP